MFLVILFFCGQMSLIHVLNENIIFPMEKILNKTNEIARDPIKVIYNIFKARQSQINE
jgi:hypothetical protein